MRQSPITSHILDTSLGKPAEGIVIEVEQSVGEGTWTAVGRDTTNADGRAGALLSSDAALAPGIYRLTFHTDPYFAATGRPSFYPIVHIIFRIEDPSQHYHIPLLLNPFGYSTYRGS
jgi:5-hydroxyisourate hydrolase